MSINSLRFQPSLFLPTRRSFPFPIFQFQMIGIPFCGSAHRDLKNPAGNHMQAPSGSPKQLACGADSPRKPISTRQYPITANYVNLSAGEQAGPSWFSGRAGRCLILEREGGGMESSDRKQTLLLSKISGIRFRLYHLEIQLCTGHQMAQY